VTGSTVDLLAPVVDATDDLLAPVTGSTVDLLAPVVDAPDDLLAPVTGSTVDLLAPVVDTTDDLLAPVTDATTTLVAPVLDEAGGSIGPVVQPLVGALAPVLDSVDSATPITGGLNQDLLPAGGMTDRQAGTPQGRSTPAPGNVAPAPLTALGSDGAQSPQLMAAPSDPRSAPAAAAPNAGANIGRHPASHLATLPTPSSLAAASVEHASGGGSSAPGSGAPQSPQSPAPSSGAGAAGGSGFAFGTFFALLASLAALAALRYGRRLSLASAPWRPAAFIAVIERPG
ncbi:MAG TPA: hypothetical protein VHJ37_06850, partial [Thermoleophilaceae bacterium]|nr:hypothetical protein [Thermoleophilaceae bacterium]